MVSSNISQSTSGQPQFTRRNKKERSQVTLWSVATVFFLLGSAITTLTIWQLHNLYRATIAPVVTVEGTLKAKYGYQQTSNNELTPAPGGYYIDSPGIGRVYLQGKPLDSYVGQTIKAQGSVSGICGPKSIPCYPLVEVREVGAAAVE